MPVSNKRPSRGRPESSHTEEALVDSSPTRPNKRRKRMSDEAAPEEPTHGEPAPEELSAKPLPLDRAGIDMDDEQLIMEVSQHLQFRPCNVLREHSNEKYASRNEPIRAYAKVTGKDWTYYIKHFRNTIGRYTEPPAGRHRQDDEMVTDIDLGPHRQVSRQHAEIFVSENGDTWYLAAYGKTYTKVDNVLLKAGDSMALHSGSVIEIAGVEMMFVLHTGAVEIDKRYLRQAGLIQEEKKLDSEESKSRKGKEVTPAQESVDPESHTQEEYAALAPTPIAPYPANHQRQTPKTARPMKGKSSAKKSPGYSGGGTILMNGEDIDCSLDQNQDIKPTYSYGQMIAQAILAAPNEKSSLDSIYKYITKNYAFYRNQKGGGWQNSIRHNLSLSKAFKKVEREKDQPGKGGLWYIDPEHYEEQVASCHRTGRGGFRGSSAPSSPANFAKDTMEPSSANRSKRSPSVAQRGRGPLQGGSPRKASPLPSANFTPDRFQTSNPEDEFPGDGSPLPRHKRPQSTYGLSENIARSPPPLSSSYLPEDAVSYVTPAPKRHHPILAPPSTAQRPSQMMPTSSPAPFWKYADTQLTPFAGAFDSPAKNTGLPPSSSPPSIRGAGSPSARNSFATKLQATDNGVVEEEAEEGLDLASNTFQSIGSFHSASMPSFTAPSPLKGR